MLISLFRYLGGYMKLKIEGNAIERFFTLCGKKDILLWNITYKKDYYECFVSARGFEEMEVIMEKTNTKITVLEKCGLPFFLHCHRKRKVFVLGFFLCIILVYTLSLFVWDIEVIGTYTHTKEEILKYMKQKNILSGVLKKDINCAKLEEDMREDFDDVAWVSCELDGTRLTVHLKESLQTDTSKKQKEPCDLSARKSATITSIITREGTPLVQKGDKVKKGDTLISGLIYIYDDANEILEAGKVAADGDVYGRTVYEYEDSFESSYYEKKYTKEERKNYTIQIGEYQIKLWEKTDKNKNYDTLSEKKQLKIGTNLYLPASIEKITLRNYEQKRKTDTKEEMENKAKQRLNKFLDGLKKKGVSILENHVKIEVNEGKCSAKGKIIVNESIAKIRTINKNAVKDSLKEKQQKDSEGQ
ncbi:MAG: sporulation protein YqfD [Lachnospiraceae bacterium]